MRNDRVFNFSAGPSMLPESVLLRAQEEFLNYGGSGMSVLEMSHRSKVFIKIYEEAEAGLRSVLGVPDNYKILFLHGGATGAFAALAMNLGNKNHAADYVITGNFSNNAYKEGKKYVADCRIAGSSEDDGFRHIPVQEELTLNPAADYLHVCWNNTIFGTTWHYVPETAGVPVVADMSSSILSEPVDVSRYGVVYAGVQKNMAPSGLAVVIIREDLLGNAMAITPNIWDFAKEADKDSMLNTPPTYPIYFIKLVTDWIRDEIGGLEALRDINRRKAALLYDYLDSQSYYRNEVRPADRSMMNVVFRTGDDEKDAAFVKGSIAEGFTNLKGHRLVGGMRASIYNAMPEEGVRALIDYMERFAKENP